MLFFYNKSLLVEKSTQENSWYLDRGQYTETRCWIDLLFDYMSKPSELTNQFISKKN